MQKLGFVDSENHGGTCTGRRERGAKRASKHILSVLYLDYLILKASME